MISSYPISIVLTAGISAFYLLSDLFTKQTRSKPYITCKSIFLVTLAISCSLQLVRIHCSDQDLSTLLLHSIIFLNFTSLLFFIHSYSIISENYGDQNTNLWSFEHIFKLFAEFSVLITGVISLIYYREGFFYDFDLIALIKTDPSGHHYWHTLDIEKSVSIFLYAVIFTQLTISSFKAYKNKDHWISYIIICTALAQILNYTWNSNILADRYPRQPISSLTGLIWMLFFVITDKRDIFLKEFSERNLLKQMTEKESAINAYLSNISVLGALVTQDGRIIASNTLFNETFELDESSPTIFLKKEVSKCKSLTTRSEFIEALELAAIGENNKAQIKFLTKEGFVKYYEFHFTRSTSLYQNSLSIFIEGQDITDIIAKIQEIESAKRLQSIGKLASGAAHDFNNIMTAVSGLAEISIQEHPTSPSRHNLELIFKAAKRGNDITKNLLAFSRHNEASNITFNLVQILDESIILLKSTGSKLVQIEQNYILKEAFIAGNPSDIHNLIINLLINAYDAIKGAGSITVSLEEEIVRNETVLEDNQTISKGTYYLLSITDTGKGIPKTILAKVFEPFFTTKTIGKGTGLGLAAARETAENHNGVITLESEENKGTTIYVYLPKSLNTKTKEDDTPHIASEPATADIQKIVAILDDDEMVLTSVDKMVKSMGIKTFPFSNADSFLDWMRAQSHYPNCILLDLNMPHMSGIEVYTKLRADFQNLNIIIMTGYYENMANSDLEKDINVRILMKPFGIDKLQHSLNSYLDSKSQS
jgi:signal transduction histidine kinase/CheY-like chemotaxis protein